MKTTDEVKTRLVFENYGDRLIWESPYDDVTMDDILNALYGILVAKTWQPVTVIQAMKDFAEEHEYLLKDNEDEFTNETPKPHFYA